MKEPETLEQAIRYFTEPDNCLNYIVARRWPNGVNCPTCGGSNIGFLSTRRLWECKSTHPRKQFSVKVGTIFEDSPLGLEKWLAAMWLLVNCKNGVSSYEVARDLGISQKSAWHMMHRIRLALQSGSLMKLGGDGGEVEVDETFIGGKARNMHVDKRQRRITGTGGKDKAAVVGILERGGQVRAAVIPNRRKVEPFHLFRYLDEQAYRFNNRKLSDAERFSMAVSGIVGKRVMFRELTGAAEWRIGQS